MQNINDELISYPVPNLHPLLPVYCLLHQTKPKWLSDDYGILFISPMSFALPLQSRVFRSPKAAPVLTWSQYNARLCSHSLVT